MKIDEVINALQNAEKLAIPPHPWQRPDFTVYMDVDYHEECMVEILNKKAVHPLANEFYHDGGDYIRGCKVWRVIPDKNLKHHKPFHIITKW